MFSNNTWLDRLFFSSGRIANLVDKSILMLVSVLLMIIHEMQNTKRLMKKKKFCRIKKILKAYIVGKLLFFYCLPFFGVDCCKTYRLYHYLKSILTMEEQK